MATEGMKRKLTAILSADVKDYSRLMAEDEVATVQRITTYRDLIGVRIKEHRGRVVDSPGDNLLAEFPSALDATRCAVEIQGMLKNRNADLPTDRRMEFRIGIHLGDVVVDGGRIYGDSVNVAARLENLADPGGICISEMVHGLVRNKLDLDFGDMGEKQVKGINDPVKMYRVLMGDSDTESSRDEVDSVGDEPSIAVLPFASLGGDPEQSYIADGMTQGIIYGLSQNPYLLVIAWDSISTFRNQPVDIKNVGHDLKVRYVLKGSIQQSGNRLRIIVQLIDSVKGNYLWSETFNRDLNMEDVFALQDDITKSIMVNLQVQLVHGEQEREIQTNSLVAYVKFLKGRELNWQLTRESMSSARRLYEEAIALDPNFSAPYSCLSNVLQYDISLGISKSPADTWEQSLASAKKALALNRFDPYGHYFLAKCHCHNKQYEDAISECKAALLLRPTSADNIAFMGIVLSYAGRHHEAIAWLDKAYRLNPIPPSWYLSVLGCCYASTERYDEAIKVLNLSLEKAPNNLLATVFLTLAYALSGLRERARAQASGILEVEPSFSLQDYFMGLPYEDDSVSRWIEDLKGTGLR